MLALVCFERRQNALRDGFRFEQRIQVDSLLIQNTIAWGGLLQDEDRPAEQQPPRREHQQAASPQVRVSKYWILHRALSSKCIH
jgi:hypothetical protein